MYGQQLRMGLGVENGSGYPILCMWPHKHIVYQSYLKIYSCKGYQTQTKGGSLFCEEGWTTDVIRVSRPKNLSL